MRLSPVWALVVAWLTIPLSLAAAERWELQYFYDKNDSTLSFTDMQFPSTRRGAALGIVAEERRRKPVMAVTSDGGAHWELLPLKEPGASIFFFDEANGWMVGHKGRISKTADGGRTWTIVPQPDPKAQTVRVFFRDASHGYALCTLKKVFSTQDGGRSWQLMETSRKPDLKDEETVYTGIGFHQQTGLITGWSRDPESERHRGPTDPVPMPMVRYPTDAVLLLSRDGGQTWKFSLLPKLGQIERVAISSTGAAMLLLIHPESFLLGAEVIGLDLQSVRGKPVYAERRFFVSDIAFAGPNRVLAAVVDQEGRTALPAIPGPLRVLQSTDGDKWTEIPVDYRAEARRAVMAAPDATHAWIATDTGMILRLVAE